ncbi:NfeD family protein [Candidatus Nitrospira bockiana]
MTWWYWVFIGLALLTIEIVTPGGFYVFFFGLAALAVGALAGLSLVTADWLQWLLFSVLSIASLLLFRAPLQRWLKAQEPAGEEIDTMVGEMAVLLDDVAPDGVGKAELRGSAWTARNAGPTGLKKGQRARVERVQGLTLWVTAD